MQVILTGPLHQTWSLHAETEQLNITFPAIRVMHLPPQTMVVAVARIPMTQLVTMKQTRIARQGHPVPLRVQAPLPNSGQLAVMAVVTEMVMATITITTRKIPIQLLPIAHLIMLTLILELVKATRQPRVVNNS